VTFALTPRRAQAFVVAIGMALSVAGATRASAEALLLVEAESGKVLHAENATYPWYPASITKIMTAYVTLRAVKERRLTLETLLTVSANAAAQAPSKMGFAVGTTVTVDNALKMLMVKSANDIAVVLAEGVSGSIEQFADEMNRAARRLGMTQSSFVNPNGLPSELQITSARDMAILARAVYREMPEYEIYWRVPAIRFGKRTMRNYNTLIGRYEGADGMKTGFICASGFNLVASATRDGKRLIAVVLGAPSSPVRAAKAAQLLERGFSSGMLSWLTPSLGTVDALQPIDAAPPNLREDMCGKHRKRPAAEDEDDDATVASGSDSGSPHAFMLSNLRGSIAKPSTLLGPIQDTMPAVVVHAGPPKKQGAPAPQFAVAGAPKPTARGVAPATAESPPPGGIVTEEATPAPRRAKKQAVAAPKTAVPKTATPKSTAAPKTAAAPKATAAPKSIAAPKTAATPKTTAAPKTAAAAPKSAAPKATPPKPQQ
jgi:D-alanyl-D-alanine carboxypeptidase